jgi:RimJ/RimL family protein N-acetyltransferase
VVSRSCPSETRAKSQASTLQGVLAVTTWDGQLPSQFELSDGSVVSVRELHESDEVALRSWYGSLSPESRYQRFHGHSGDLSAAQWRYLTNIDGVDHVAIVVLHDNELVGIARMIRLDELESAAEITFLVDDAFRGRGVGSLLRDVLFVLATRRTYRRLLAFVLPDNVAIRRLLAGTKRRLVDRRDVLEVAVGMSEPCRGQPTGCVSSAYKASRGPPRARDLRHVTRGTSRAVRGRGGT